MNATLTQPDPAKAREYFSNKMEFTTGPAELKRAMDRDEVVIVDVRAAEDFAKGHIPGAINLPQDRWQNPEGLRRDKANVLYCYSQVCHLAANAAVELSADGYPVMELEGGFDGWKQNDLPVESGAESPGKGSVQRSSRGGSW
ncbi:MAG TPA: rhodanese-like domain-containing protein [Lacunisphaera sp.]|nr:rhodanese-like domain-containing protein [Lacunisphaera sp.]